MSFHLLSRQILLILLLPLILHNPSAESATNYAKKLPPALNATNTEFHCTSARAWTTSRQPDLRAADCRKAIEELNREGDKQRAKGGQWGAPYWANPRAFDRPLGYPTVWTPVRFASGAWHFRAADDQPGSNLLTMSLTGRGIPRLLRAGSCIDGASGKDTRQARSTLRRQGWGVLDRNL